MDKFKINLFNVGSGDCILIEFPERKIGILDTFCTYENIKLIEPPTLTYLKYRLSEKLESKITNKICIKFICISHADLDHIKEMDSVLKYLTTNKEHFEVENLWLFGGSTDLSTFKSEVDELSRKILNHNKTQQKELKVRFNSLKSSLDSILEFKKFFNTEYGKEVRHLIDLNEIMIYNKHELESFFCLAPLSRIANEFTDQNVKQLIKYFFEKIQIIEQDYLKGIVIETPLNRNSISSVLSIIFSGKKFLFCGDITEESFSASLNDIEKLNIKVLREQLNPHFIKSSHHGDSHSTTLNILQKLLNNPPNNIKIGVSAGNLHSHPRPEFYKCYKDFKIANTDVEFNIFTSNLCEICKSCIEDIEEEDQDHWFKYHGVLFEDKRVNEVFRLENNNSASSNVGSKNLLSYIFEFDGSDIKVKRGTSNFIGGYNSCHFDPDRRLEHCR